MSTYGLIFGYETLKELFVGICDAIRAKEGSTGLIYHQDIPSRIEALESGGIDDENLTPSNIKAGVTIGEVTGTFTSDANAQTGQILAGYSGYVNGEKVAGTMEDCSQSGSNITSVSISATLKTMTVYPPKTGYYSSSKTLSIPYATITSKIYLTAPKLVAGNTILGIVGTAPRYVSGVLANNTTKVTIQKYDGSAWVDTSAYLFTSTQYSIAFTPKVIKVSIKNTSGVTYTCCIFPTSPVACWYKDTELGNPPELLKRDANDTLIYSLSGTTMTLKIPSPTPITTNYVSQIESWE